MVIVMIRVISVGKRNEPWVDEGVREYQKRLDKRFGLEWVLIPNSAKSGLEGPKDEAQRILKSVDEHDFVILLDERGKCIDSPALSKLLAAQTETGRRVVIVIGGAYGVSDEVRSRADFVWSLSDLVFPHQLVRLILTEQIYRAQEIYMGRPYHHE